MFRKKKGALLFQEHASASEIRTSWRKMALVYHPDKILQSGTDMSEKKAKETFEKIRLAFEVLFDQPTRRQYDRKRDSAKASEDTFEWAKKKTKTEKKPKGWKPAGRRRSV